MKTYKLRSIQVPRMTGEQAYLLSRLLDEITLALWGAYGDDMADFQGRAFPDEPSPPDSVTTRDCPEGDTEIKF